MRRAAPILIVLIGLAALVVDFLPNLQVPVIGGEPGEIRRLETRLGLDLEGGLRIEYQVEPVEGRDPGPSDLAVVRDIIERRVNASGVAEPVVQTQGSDRIVVEMPGVTDPDAIRRLVGTTGRLEFVPLPAERFGTRDNEGPEFAVEGQPIPSPVPTPLFGGEELASANPDVDENGQRAVAFTLHDTGSRLFADYTRAHIGEFFAIVLDGNVVSAPSINSAITGGTGLISGGFSVADRNNLVTVLRFGSLPFPVRELTVTNISATLGEQFLRNSLLAAGIGIGLVFVFMLLYYRLPGLIADGALIYYALVVLAIFRLVPVTLTLAGIAGFVLSVGMAVDANILIFERTKEELRLGKSLTAALEAGFSRAWNSILDSNVSSLITAIILFWFGSSVIKGFALVLIIGVLTSMFTAITVTRTILRVLVRQEWARRPALWGMRPEEFAARQVGVATAREARGRA